MSIFKVREWWSVGAEEAEGARCTSRMAAERLGGHDADCLVLGDATALRVFKPEGAHRPEHLLVEEQLDEYILQVDTGKFISATEDLQVIVLHPLKLSVFMLERKEGHTGVGDQNVLLPIVTQTFNKMAFSLVHGNFGNTKNRELVCVQSLDGTFYFFDQEEALFSCSLPNITIPGPFGYIKSCDSFVIHKSNWILEIYSYQQMMDIGNPGQRTNKNILPQWVYNPGEEIYSLQVIQTSNNFSSIVVLGERYLYCLQDNGLVKYMKKFDFMPVCCHAYLIGWYYEPNSRLLVMVASEDSKLLIYENTTLLWSCELFFTPIAILRCFLKGLPGAIVALSEEGTLSCCYLGTEPDLSGAMPLLPSQDAAEPHTVQSQLDDAEAQLKKLTENEDVEDDISIEDVIKVSVVVNDCVQHLSDSNSTNEIYNLVSPVVVNMRFKEPEMVQNIQVTYFCSPPLECSEAVKSLDRVNAFETVETQIFLSKEIDICELYVKVVVMLTDDEGKILTVSEDALLPFTLLYVPSPMTVELQHNVTIITKISDIDLLDLFSEYSKESWIANGATSKTITFTSRSTNMPVCINSVGQSFNVLSDQYSNMTAVIDYFIVKIKMRYTSESVFVQCQNNLSVAMVQSFIKSIESHASARLKCQQHQEELAVLQNQFTLIQKKLLVQYGALPPGDCDNLEFLLKDTYQRISQTVQQIIEWKEAAFRAGGGLICEGRLVVMILELMNADKTKTDLLKEALSLHSLYEDHQDWEETASQSISHILSTMFGKSDKDKEKLAPVTEEGILKSANLKRFTKQIKILFERMFGNFMKGRPADEGGSKILLHSQPERVEEIVEVL